MVDYYKVLVTKYDVDMVPIEYVVYVRKEDIADFLNEFFIPEDTEMQIVQICKLGFEKDENVRWIKIKK